MDINDIIEASGVPAKVICARFGIPIRTMRSWTSGYRKPADYILTMLADIFTLELMLEVHMNMNKEDQKNDEEANRLGKDLLGNSSRGGETGQKSQSENAETREILTTGNV